MSDAIIPTPSKKRRIIPLHPHLADLNKNNYKKVAVELEFELADGSRSPNTIPQECFVATQIDVGRLQHELKKLNAQQLHTVTRNFGVIGTLALTKFVCRKGLAIQVSFLESMEKNDISTITNKQKVINTIVWITNTVFHPDFVQRFLHLNDNKNCCNHELGTAVESFWADTYLFYKDIHSNNPHVDKICNNNNNPSVSELELEGLYSVQIDDVCTLSKDTFCKKVLTLLKVRSKMKTNMNLSGKLFSIFMFVSIFVTFLHQPSLFLPYLFASTIRYT